MMPSELPPEESAALQVQLAELQQKLTFQQRAFEQLNEVVLEQQAELTTLRRELEMLRHRLPSLHDTDEDLPHEKPPHY